MIYLIVGQPRSGKSQYAVKVAFDIHDENLRIQKKLDDGKDLADKELMQNKDGEMIPAIRQIYSDIDEHSQRNEFIKLAPQDWRDVDDGSVIFYDEVHFRDEYLDQNKYMSQNEMIKELSTHGHRNIDIYLMTQDPRRLEKSIRALIFKMYLVKRPANLPPFANIYTFDRWLGDPWSASKNKDNVHDEKIFKYKKKYQEAYKSASSHTSISFKLQNKFIVAIIAIISMIALSIFLFKLSGMGKIVTDATNAGKIVEETKVDDKKIMQSAYGKQTTQQESTPEQREAERREAFNAEMEKNRTQLMKYNVNTPYDIDYTSFQYQVTETPQLSGCAIIDKQCSCYSQQGTRLDISIKDCKRYMNGDRPFNPFNQVRMQYDQRNNQGNSSLHREQDSSQISLDDYAKYHEYQRMSQEYQRSYPQNNNEISSGFG